MEKLLWLLVFKGAVNNVHEQVLDVEGSGKMNSIQFRLSVRQLVSPGFKCTGYQSNKMLSFFFVISSDSD